METDNEKIVDQLFRLGMLARRGHGHHGHGEECPRHQMTERPFDPRGPEGIEDRGDARERCCGHDGPGYRDGCGPEGRGHHGDHGCGHHGPGFHEGFGPEGACQHGGPEFRDGFGPEGPEFRGGPSKVQHGQGRVLTLLAMKNEEGLNQRELAYLLGIRPQSLGETLGKLEAKGYITRTHDGSDKRAAIVTLTEAGKEHAAEMSQRRKNDADQLLSVLSDEERKQLAAILDKLCASLEDPHEDAAEADSE